MDNTDHISDDDEAPPISCRMSQLGLASSKQIGHIEIHPSELVQREKIGTGNTADVFKGVWRGDAVAIKQIKGDSSVALKMQIAFTRELAVLSKCNHPYLCCFRGACLESAPLRIVTEFCAGGTLFDLLHNNGTMDISNSQRLKMCSDVAQGMHYLHTSKLQIIHRDLKSLNCFLLRKLAHPTDVPHVKIADFGTARIKEELHADWDNMTALGTVHWMAPEVHAGRYCEKADVYSYAMVLFEILCRAIPFEDKKPHQVCLLTVSGKRPCLKAVPPNCPPSLTQLMIRCWDHEPATRPSFAEVLDVLRQIDN